MKTARRRSDGHFAAGRAENAVVHITKSQSPAKHERLIEAAAGHDHMVCTMRDTAKVIEVRGGRM
jgi:hypothetical protein